MRNRKIENGCLPIFFKNYCCGVTYVTSVVSLRLMFFPYLLKFKITDYNEKLAVSNKSLSLKVPRGIKNTEVFKKD